MDNYVIDFDRLNELTSHANDNPNSSQSFTTGYCYSLTRKLLKEHMEVYSQYGKTSKISDVEYQKVCATLRYNKILITPADLRDKKISSVLDK